MVSVNKNSMPRLVVYRVRFLTLLWRLGKQLAAPNFSETLSSFMPKQRGASVLPAPGLMLDNTSAAGLESSNPGNVRSLTTESG